MTTLGCETSSIRALGRRLRVGQWNRAQAALGEPPIVVFSGIGMNLELLDPLAAALAPRRVISLDMPGIGGSPDPLVPYSPLTMAMTVSVAFDRLGVDQADVIGISWGGALAQQFALQHRPRVRRLVLAATSAGMTMAPGKLSDLAQLGDPTQFTVGKTMRRTLAALYNGGGAGIPVSLNAATAPSPAGWIYQLAALAGWSSLPLLPFLDVPTLILTGDDDRVVPPVNARILHAMIPGSRLQVIPGGGHLFILSHLAEVADTLHRFLADDAAVESV